MVGVKPPLEEQAEATRPCPGWPEKSMEQGESVPAAVEVLLPTLNMKS